MAVWGRLRQFLTLQFKTGNNMLTFDTAGILRYTVYHFFRRFKPIFYLLYFHMGLTSHKQTKSFDHLSRYESNTLTTWPHRFRILVIPMFYTKLSKRTRAAPSIQTLVLEVHGPIGQFIGRLGMVTANKITRI